MNGALGSVDWGAVRIAIQSTLAREFDVWLVAQLKCEGA